MATKSKTAAKRKRAPARRKTPKKAAPRTRGVLPNECRLDALPAAFELDEKVADVIDKLKKRGLVSPYLRAFVVARVNPLRWIKDDPPPLPEVLKTMKERLAKFNVDKVNQQDLAKTGGAPDSE